MSKRTSYIGFAVFCLLILMLATIWHRPPFIQDAITGAPAPGYGVHISPGYIIFEPLIGPLLFFMRANKPIVLYLLLIAWIIVITFIVRYRSQLGNDIPHLKALATGLRSSLFWLPVVLAVFIFILLLMIFLPLPVNTIVNKNPDTLLINFHSHSYNSYDGLMSPQRLMAWHQSNHFDAFFLTEHRNHDKTLELTQMQANGQLPSHPLLLAGEEFSGSNHIILLGLQHDFRSKGLTDEAAIDTAHAQGGAVFVAHWFTPKGGTRPIAAYIAAGVDGFEIANYARGIYYNQEHIEVIHKACQQNHLLMIGGADYHGYGAANYVWNALSIPNWHKMERAQQIAAVMEILRNHDQSRLQVLVYRDRAPMPQNMLIIAPVVTLVSYFQTLNAWQLVSWFLWLILFGLLNRWRQGKFGQWWISHSPATIGCIIGVSCSVIILLIGIWLFSQYPLITKENRIYRESGLWLIGLGTLFFLHCFMLTRKIKKINIYK